MSKLQQKKFTYSVLGAAISENLYLCIKSRQLWVGVGYCVMSSFAYAEEVIVAHPDTTNTDEAIAKIEQKTRAQITQAVEEQQQNKQQQQIEQQHDIAAALENFRADAVYQLNESDIPQPDSKMVEEIMRVAQDAEQDAQQQLENVPSITTLTQQDMSSSPNMTAETNQDEKELSQSLMTRLQSESLTLPEVKKEEDFSWADDGEDSLAVQAKKPGILSRIFRRNKDDLATVEKLPKIQVRVVGAEGELEDNIKAKLSTFTVDAFTDFNIALPQLKNMAKQAAQAVGYYQAEFHFQKESETQLLVSVKPYEPVLVQSQKIEFSGEGAKRPAFQVIKVVPDLNEDDIFQHQLYETTKSRITNAASNQGYFDAYWHLHDVKVTLPENTADIHLKYETGERYQLHGVEFRMSNPDKPFPLRASVLEKLVPFKDGDDYMDWRINSLSNNLTNSRYFNYALVDVIKPDPIEHELDVPEDVQQILAQQNNISSENINRAESSPAEAKALTVDESVFAGAEEQELQPQTRLMNVQDNDAAIEEADRLKEQARLEKKIPVRVTLNADNLNNLEAGIGYGTDSGIRLRSQYRRSIVNDRGHSFDANMELSQKRQAIDGRYMIPYKHPLEDYISLIGGYEREVRGDVGQGIELDIESIVMGAERTVKKPLGEWQHNMSMRYRLDRITSRGAIDENDIPNAFKVVSDKPEQESFLLGYEISRIQQDKRINPTQGFKQVYRVEAGTKSLLTETDMAIINASWGFIYSLGDNANHQFVGRADAGYIVTDNFNQVPYNLRYFAGGDQSIRGYDYKSLSPIENDLLIGGQALGIGSLEYNYQFKPGWRAAIFADAGNAYDEKFSNPTKYGVGLGVRWASPVGPIRIDVGAGISEDSIPIRLHFFIGPPL